MNRSKIVLHLLLILILIGLLLSLHPPAIALAGSKVLPSSDQVKIDAYIQSRMRIDHIPGLALGVVRGDQVIYLKGYSTAGQDGRAVTPQTPFIIDSSSKSFTALAVMQLVEAGKIDLDAPVTKYIPWFRTDDLTSSNQITVHNLLNQDSGLGYIRAARAWRITIKAQQRSSRAFASWMVCSSASQLARPSNIPM